MAIVRCLQSHTTCTRTIESRADKESWLMALNDAKYGRLADLQTLQQTATIRQSKRKSLHAVSRRSSSSAFPTAHEPYHILEEGLVSAVEVDGYHSPVPKSAALGCAKCRSPFTIIKTPHPCLLACGKLFCSECLTRVSTSGNLSIHIRLFALVRKQSFSISGEANGKTRQACDTCYFAVFRSSTGNDHDVLDTRANFTLSRQSREELKRERQESAVSMTGSSALSRTSTGSVDLAKLEEQEPSQAVKVLRGEFRFPDPRVPLLICPFPLSELLRR